MADEITTKKRKTTRPRKAPKPSKEPEAPDEEKHDNSSSGANASQSFDSLAALRALPASTSRIVEQAASILEEEIAAGIVAAKRVENRIVDSNKLRSKDPQEVMQRFRKDAHDVLDILVDMVNLATNSLGNLTQRVITISEGPPKNSTPQKGSSTPTGIPSLDVEQPVKAGQSVEIPLTLENGGDKTTEEFGFYSSDLLKAGGGQISSENISFVPKMVAIDPHGSKPVTVVVSIPENTSPGIYSGLVQATKLELLRAVLTVRVV